MHISFQKKKIVEWICENGIAEIGKKKFVVMSLPKMRGKKKVVIDSHHYNYVIHVLDENPLLDQTVG